MSYIQQPSGSSRQWTLPMAWFPVLLGLTVICLESTRTMGAANTAAWLLAFCDWLWGHVNETSVLTANFVLRKLGHFFGYGMLSLLFRRAWIITFRLNWKGPRSRLIFSASALAVICTFFVACADELHQIFLPGRTSSFHDVLLDTSGALLANWMMAIVLKRRRRALLESPSVHLR
jgi:VanZ family protein